MTKLELRARKIAAIKMGLIKDPDGLRLPDDLWKQALPIALRETGGDCNYEREEIS
jgi:hypothetical protein